MYRAFPKSIETHLHDKLDWSDEVSQELENQVFLLLLHLIETIPVSRSVTVMDPQLGIKALKKFAVRLRAIIRLGITYLRRRAVTSCSVKPTRVSVWSMSSGTTSLCG
jgi:hypothetical protein